MSLFSVYFFINEIKNKNYGYISMNFFLERKLIAFNI